MISEAYGRYFGLVSAGTLFFPLGSFSCYFGLKPLKCFLFLATRVCPLVNLPSIKRADPTALSPIPPKT